MERASLDVLFYSMIQAVCQWHAFSDDRFWYSVGAFRNEKVSLLQEKP